MSLLAVGRHLKTLRQQRDLTQLEVALSLGFSQSLVSLIDKGAPVGHVKTILEYAHAVGADQDMVRRELIDAVPALRAANRNVLADEIEEQIAEVA